MFRRARVGDRSEPPVGFVANLGYRLPPNGQTLKARALLELLNGSGRRVDVVDLGARRLNLLRVVSLIVRGRTVVVVLNRRGLWVVLAMVALLRPFARRPGAVLVPVVGGWLPDYLAAKQRYRRLARVADEFLAETRDMVAALAGFGLSATELPNFRRLPVELHRVRRSVHEPVRLCFAARVRFDKGVVVAARLVERLRSLGLPCELDIYGPVEEQDACEAAEGVDGVRYRGCYSGPAEALEVLSRYDFLVLPSSYEGECMPGAVVEGCFAALPSIVSDWKYLREVVADGATGYVCPLDSFVECAAQRVLDCLQPGRYEQLSRHALGHAADRFTEAAAAAVLTARIRARERPAGSDDIQHPL